VTSRRASRSIIYSANFKAMTGLLAYLTENCCGGNPELCAPQACASAVATAGINQPGRQRRKAGTSARSRDG